MQLRKRRGGRNASPAAQQLPATINSTDGAENEDAINPSAVTTTTTPAVATMSLLQRATEFMDSFHGRQLSDKNTNQLDIWRIRCLLTVAWSTGFSGAALVPLYLMAKVYSLAFTLGAGSILLLIVPSFYQRRKWTERQCSTVVACTSVVVMTILTTGSGGFPSGLAPGIQRIIPILVLCFGSLQLGAFVTVYVIVEAIAFFVIGPFPAALDDEFMLSLICLGSWTLQPVMLFCLGVSLHMAGTQTVETLMSVSEAKARFLSIVSHELRTPLHGILGSCDLGLTGTVEDQNEALVSCQMAAKHLSLIVEDLLLYSSSAAIRIREEPFELGQLYRSLKATLQQSETRCKLLFVHPSEKMWFLGDELRLRQCFINVIGNGLKFCSENDTITVQLLESEPGCEPNDPWKLRFRIKDTGPGISPDDRERIFAPFEQAVGTTQKSLSGVGLGLSIVVALSQKMGGGIACESELGKGSSFFLTVRLRRTHDPTNDAKELAPIKPKVDPLTDPLEKINEEVPPLLADSTTTIINKHETPAAVPTPTPNKQVPSKPTKDEACPSPIVIATIDECDMSCLQDWEGEANTFRVLAEWNRWPDVMKCADGATSDVDLIVVDDSKEALHTVELVFREQIHSVPLVRVYNDDSKPAPPCELFDATIHIQALPGLLRSWYRALALGAWILVVDDVALNRKVLRKLLSRLGHRVSEASDGLEGSRKAESAGFGHDMIAMDIMMPVMDGFAATKKIRARERLVRGPSVRLCPIFAVTAGDKTMSADWSDFNGFLEKPTSVKKLRRTVRHQVIRRLLP